MLFSLEVLQAKHGDCLILHYGSTTEPKVIVIDGGPSGVYTNFLRPRLLHIKAELCDQEPLPLEMVLITHADDDHINGIKMLTNELVSENEGGVSEDNKLFVIKKLWFNAFDDIIGNIEIPVVANLSGEVTAATNEILGNPLLASMDHHLAAIIASTGQGRNIRDNAELLGITLNAGFSKLDGVKAKLVRDDTGMPSIDVNGLSLKVISPNGQRLRELQLQWDLDLQEARDKGDESIILASLTSIDKSPFNLSSIVCVAEFEGKRMLLTGDGRCDDILAGLSANGLLDESGKAHFDILKMPHHGSDANMKPDFLIAVTADHYVVSADGKHHNPDQTTLDMMADNITSGKIHFTNHDGEFDLGAKMDGFAQKLEANGSSLSIGYPIVGKNSSVLDLLDSLPY